MNTAQRFARIRHILFFIFLGLIATSLLLYAIFGEEFSVQEIHSYAKSFGLWLPLAFILFYAGASIFLPATPMMAVAGILFGFTYGLIYTTIGGFISALITFYISRYLGKDFVDKLLHKKFLSKVEEYDEKISKRGFTTVMILRMLPIMPFNVLNLIMGISKVKTKDYLFGTLVGLAPSNMLAVYFGKVIFILVANKYISALLGVLFLTLALFIFVRQEDAQYPEQ